MGKTRSLGWLKHTALAGILLAAPIAIDHAHAQERQYTLNIPAQPLSAALRAYAQATGEQIVFSEEIVADLHAPALHGDYTSEAALERLLAGSGLVARRTPRGSLMVIAATDPRADASSPTQLTDVRRVSPGNEVVEEEDPIIVVGTNIRGVQPSFAPVDVFTVEDVRRTGATTTEQFMERLPQNLGTRTEYAPTSGSSSNFNREAVTTPTLRGLGVGTTLTLVNGRRMALSSGGQAADVSAIPLVAISRVEVLSDGASAIYGSDAIGGVVNFVLRDDFDGGETRFSYGAVTEGGLRQGEFSQALGRTWSDGHALASYSFASASALAAEDRSYTFETLVNGQGNLTPDHTAHRAFITASQNLNDRWRVSGDLGYSIKDVKLRSVTSVTTGAANANWSDTNQYFANAALTYEVSADIDVALLTTYSGVDVDTFFGATQSLPGQVFDTNYAALQTTLMASGDLPIEDLRFAAGVEYLQESYESSRDAFGSTLSGRELGRDTFAAFAELLAMPVAPEDGLPFAHRVEISLAARYTTYDDTSEPRLDQDFGSRVSPKLGLSWMPTPSINLRATYGESFRAPALTQLDPSSVQIGLLANQLIGGASSTVIQLAGPSDDLNAETAQTYTFGFDYRPRWRPTFRASATYYNIDYVDRIGTVSTVPARANPSAWPEVISQPGAVEDVQALLDSAHIGFNNTGINLLAPDAAAQLFARMPNLWVLETRTRNLASSEQDGMDFTISDRFQTPFGDLAVGAGATRIFAFDEQASANSPVVSVVDTVQRPADLRGHVYFGLETERFDTTFFVRYVDEYSNPLATLAAGGPHTVDAWTTVDWTTNYLWGSSDRSLRLNLTIQNLFDEDPPFVQPAATLGLSPGFDPANANPLGRLVVLSIAKTW
ncbi:MAG TPA: TonB-dependent receptor [Vitreimonas sp.]|uniref:TonB-dependent receptor n=1 Tax=Vitreimonas sp. TaxID=3069702 RepID=UPI002D4C634E|nr:TonB-dependent receptor [Vitreimonas sp.]HYD86041.1 TonB-dependent receptor [Vitreimonas sp.]